MFATFSCCCLRVRVLLVFRAKKMSAAYYLRSIIDGLLC